MRIILCVYGRGKFGPIQNREEHVKQGTTIRELLDQLAQKNEMPQKFGSGNGYSEFLVLVNGFSVMIGDALDAELADGDRVVVLPAIAGG